MRKIIVKLMGGLGNQMFQFAAAKKVADLLNENCEIIFDVSFLEDRTIDIVYRDYDLSIFNLSNQLDNSLNQKFNKIIINDMNIVTAINNIHLLKNDKRDLYFEGFFQIHYLVDKSMNQYYKFNEFSNKETEKFFLENITDKSLMINIRRADYVSRPSALSFHGFLGEEYIKKALLKFKNDEFDKVFIFSDEPDWCEKNLHIDNSIVVSHEYAGNKFRDYLHLMSKFRNLIIPNSTFAWWAAWISENQNNSVKIISPGKNIWFRNNPEMAELIIPNSWNKLESL